MFFIEDELLKHWTNAAKYCYKIGCICINCEIASNNETLRHGKCHMKSVVIGLVKKFGRPKL